mmetsp:Transcript_111106/g.279383  ORF Transcript_111106/g.279383 Transcript_111106/m.279383 type:complete len:268 (-) Transcript_111106:604-1407(-)
MAPGRDGELALGGPLHEWIGEVARPAPKGCQAAAPPPPLGETARGGPTVAADIPGNQAPPAAGEAARHGEASASNHGAVAAEALAPAQARRPRNGETARDIWCGSVGGAVAAVGEANATDTGNDTGGGISEDRGEDALCVSSDPACNEREPAEDMSEAVQWPPCASGCSGCKPPPVCMGVGGPGCADAAGGGSAGAKDAAGGGNHCGVGTEGVVAAVVGVAGVTSAVALLVLALASSSRISLMALRPAVACRIWLSTFILVKLLLRR